MSDYACMFPLHISNNYSVSFTQAKDEMLVHRVWTHITLLSGSLFFATGQLNHHEVRYEQKQKTFFPIHSKLHKYFSLFR